MELNEEDEARIEKSVLQATEIISLEDCPPTLPNQNAVNAHILTFVGAEMNKIKLFK